MTKTSRTRRVDNGLLWHSRSHPQLRLHDPHQRHGDLLLSKRATFSSASTGSQAESSDTGVANNEHDDGIQTIQQQYPPVVSDETIQMFLDELLHMMPDLQISTNQYELLRHGKGEDANPCVPPQAILYPTSTEQVSQICKLNSSLAKNYRIPIIAFGTGTSLEGHVAALKGGISVNTSKLQYNANADEDCVDVDKLRQDFQITVGAGVTRQTLNAHALKHTGLQFMVDPGANASLGGMVACGASGTMAVKYGTMKDNILAIQCVLANGDIVQTGTKASKSSSGYDLTRLLCGSEGTLGIITRATLRLHPIPACVHAAVCRFDTLKDAAEAVTAIKQCGVDVQRLELLDSITVEAFNKYNASKGNSSSSSKMLPVKPHLFLEFAGVSSTSVEELVNLAKSICVGDDEDEDGDNDDNANDEPRFRVETSPEARATLWAARHQLHYASLHLREGADGAVVTDACVPLSAFASVVQATANDIQELQLTATLFGHAGDGNFHCNIPICSSEDSHPESDYRARIDECNHRLLQRTLAVGGTCTGEHGIGWGKVKYLKQQYSPETLRMMKTIKRALDPHNLMNPGKVVDMDDCD
jgi:D-lactate dehydrogenase (cytochrome)